MKDLFLRVWRWVKWPVIILALAYFALVVWRVFMIMDEEKTAKAVADIHAQKLTLVDVMGETEIAYPVDEVANNATVEGIDSNSNGIRDDVELAIFEKYQNDAKTRAAAMQYAKALQIELTQVFNSPTLVAAIQKEEHADFCIAEISKGEPFEVADNRSREVEQLVLNTEVRRKKYNEIFEKYMTSYSSLPGPYCDLVL